MNRGALYIVLKIKTSNQGFESIQTYHPSAFCQFGFVVKVNTQI
ncbi:MAG: hypothetical protein RL158_1050, partial [Bacteroidota bacterium]